MWIMLRRKPPTRPSPPKLSFHWSEPWLDGRHSDADLAVKKLLNHVESTDPDGRLGGAEYRELMRKHKVQVNTGYSPANNAFLDFWGQLCPDWSEARAIIFMGEQIRVFPHEYELNHSMKEYIEAGALIFHEYPEVTHALDVLSPAKKMIFEQALLDGCNEMQAQLVSMGKDPFLAEFPPTGWYEMHPEYASAFCRPYEMTITPKEPPQSELFERPEDLPGGRQPKKEPTTVQSHDLVVGKRYAVSHKRKGHFEGELVELYDEWAEFLITEGKTAALNPENSQEQGERVNCRRSFISVIEL